MKNKISTLNYHLSVSNSRAGFTLTELVVGSSIMLFIICGVLSMYVKSNKTSVDHQQFAELQHDVRSVMFFISKDVRSAGVGLSAVFSGCFLEGVDNESQGEEVTPDRLKVLGNIEEPLTLRVANYQGAAANIALADYSFERNPYADSHYEDRVVLILPDPKKACRVGEIREITHVTHDEVGTNEKLNFSPGLSQDFNPPGGLSGTCPDSNDYDGGTITYIEVREYWLDVTGNYPGLTAGEDGYIGNGVGGVLYLTQNGLHYPLARNIENLQFQYNGDLDDDGVLDGFIDWNNDWTVNLDDDQPIKQDKWQLISRIRQVRIWVLGKTENPFVSRSGTPSSNIHLYRRPTVANTPLASQDDRHRRFLLETTANIRNMSLNIYADGTR